MTVVEVLKAARAKVAQGEMTEGLDAIDRIAPLDREEAYDAGNWAYQAYLKALPDQWTPSAETRLAAFDKAIAAEEAKP